MPGVCTMKEFSSQNQSICLNQAFQAVLNFRLAVRPEASAAKREIRSDVATMACTLSGRGLKRIETHIVTRSAFQIGLL